MEFSVQDVYDKVLYAKTIVPVKSIPLDSEEADYYIQPGQVVGTVYAHVDPAPGRSTIYWQFIGTDGARFYAPHLTGMYSIRSLRDQGLLTIEEKIEAEKERNKSTAEKVTDTLVRGLLLYGAIRVAGQVFLKN